MHEDIEFHEPIDSRNIYIEPEDRALIRTSDVWQTEIENGVAGYSETMLAIVANFDNSGAPEGYNAQSMVGKSKRGEVALRLFAVVDAGPVRAGGEPEIVNAGFKTRGCLAMTGCASVICHMIEGKTFSEALAITADDVKRAVDGVPYDKAHTPIFAVEAVHGLIGDWYYRQGLTLAEMNQVIPCDEASVNCLMCEHCSLRDTRVELLVDEARAKQAATKAQAAGAGNHMAQSA